MWIRPSVRGPSRRSPGGLKVIGFIKGNGTLWVAISFLILSARGVGGGGVGKVFAYICLHFVLKLPPAEVHLWDKCGGRWGVFRDGGVVGVDPVCCQGSLS